MMTEDECRGLCVYCKHFDVNTDDEPCLSCKYLRREGQLDNWIFDETQEG